MSPFKPMLADPIEPEKYPLRFPLLASPKIDGVRGAVRNGVCMSRSLKPIPCPDVQRVLGCGQYEGLDGELVVGSPSAKGVMQATQALMRKTQKEQLDWTYFVFDKTDMPNANYVHRMNALSELFTAMPSHPRVKLLQQVLVHTQEELDMIESTALAAGFEGLMVRDPNGPYKYGRSTAREGILCKVKRFADAEAVIVGFEELMHNENEAEINELGRTKRSTNAAGLVPMGVLGAFRCRLMVPGSPDLFFTEVPEFGVGTGISAPQRAVWWQQRDRLLGKILKFRHFTASGAKEAPRFPVFVSFRSRLDL